MVSAYRKISVFSKEVAVPKVPPREIVEVHMIPDPKRGALEIRLWWQDQRVHSAAYPMTEFRRVHFSTFPNTARAKSQASCFA